MAFSPFKSLSCLLFSLGLAVLALPSVVRASETEPETVLALYNQIKALRALPSDQHAKARRQLIEALLLRDVDRPALETQQQAHKPAPSDREAVYAMLDLIAEAESMPHGYDAVNTRSTVPPPKPPSQMTLAEIEVWTAATPGQQHAIGRYQIIPATLQMLRTELKLKPTALFDPGVQDRMAERLLNQAGFEDFLTGKMETGAFMDAIALIWAGLPLESGLSAYEGFNGNRATITRAVYQRRIDKIIE